MSNIPLFAFVFDRKKKASSSKTGIVELRITYERKRKYISTSVKILPRHWKNGVVQGCLNAPFLNNILSSFMSHANDCLLEILNKGSLNLDALASSIKASFSSSPENQTFIDYCELRATVRKHGQSADTCERYDRFLRWLRTWGKIIHFSDITDKNIMEMDNILGQTMKNYSKWNNYHRFLNSFILDAIGEGLLTYNPYKHLRIEKDKSSTGINKYLTTAEFDSIRSLRTNIPHLDRVKDLFIFQTYTCLSYTDLAAFDSSRIQKVHGKMVYRGLRGKTKQEYIFMLFKPAIEILKKYDWQLPIISNVKYNEYLKAVALMAGIDKPLSSHWARHTGATMLLNEGHLNMESVARVLGHSSTKITRQVYAKYLDDSILDDMQKFENSMSLLHNK